MPYFVVLRSGVSYEVLLKKKKKKKEKKSDKTYRNENIPALPLFR